MSLSLKTILCILFILISVTGLSAERWYSVSSGMSEAQLKQLIERAVNEKLKEGQGRPSSFSEIPNIEKRMANEKRRVDQKWRDDFRGLHRRWLKESTQLSRARSDTARKKLVASAIVATEKNIGSLKRQVDREKQVLKKDLGKIRQSVLVFGKAIYGTGESQNLTLNEVKERIRLHSGRLSVEMVNGTYIQSLTIVRNNHLVKDQIQGITEGHYKITSVYPEDVSTLDDKEDEWIYLFERVEVYPFTRNPQGSNEVRTSIQVDGGLLQTVDRIDSFMIKEQLKDSALQNWLKEELSNLNAENAELENEIQLTLIAFKEREKEINQDLQELEERLKELKEQWADLPDEKLLQTIEDDFREVGREYRVHYSERMVLDTRKVYGRPKGREPMKVAFIAIALEAWSSYEVNVGDYAEEVLVEDSTLTSYTERHLNWIPQKEAFQILYLTRRKAGSQTQYIANLGIRIQLSEKGDGVILEPEREDEIRPEITDGAEMVRIPKGEFQMGTDDGEDDEKPVHTVYLDEFYMDKYEVTNEQYAKFLNEYGKNADSAGHKLIDLDSEYCLIEKSGGVYRPKSGYENHPVIEVTWYGAAVYAQFYNKRLPTEAEWEKAARGGLVGKKYPWGDNITHDDANYSGTGGKDSWNSTSPVGSFAPNGYGLYDMAGNVSEWCTDEAGNYSESSQNNPKGPGTIVTFKNNDFTNLKRWRVLRGGSWDDLTDNLRFARCYIFVPTGASDHLGFRCAQDL